MDDQAGLVDRAAPAGSGVPSAAAGRLRRLYHRSPLRKLLRVTWDHRDLSSDDVVLASYPRSGNAWLRFLLIEMLLGDASLERIRSVAPYVGRHRAAPHVLPSGGRLIKTHEPHQPVYKRAIHLVRDPRDVALSYFQFAQRGGRIPVQSPKNTATLDRFIEDLVKGHIDPFSTWHAHLASWNRARVEGDADILRLRYEDLRADTPAELMRIASWLGVVLSVEEAAAVAERSTIVRMRAAEREAIRSAPQMFPRAAQATGLFLVNEGRVAGWRDVLDVEQLARFRPMADGLALMGYPPA